MPQYDRSFNPPAPVIWVEVSDPTTGKPLRIRAQIDSGSSISVIPSELAGLLELESSGRIRVAGFDLRPKRLPTYTVNLLVEGYIILNAEVAAGTRSDMLLGRDVLQHFILTLNGKEGKFDLVDP